MHNSLVDTLLTKNKQEPTSVRLRLKGFHLVERQNIKIIQNENTDKQIKVSVSDHRCATTEL